MTEEILCQEMKKGLLGWYPFKKGSRILCIQEENDAWERSLGDGGHEIETIRTSDWQVLSDRTDSYDVIIAIHTIERITEKKEFLSLCRKALTPQGILLLGMDNRLGLRFFCGDRDPYSEHVFDSIDGYRRLGYRGIDRNSMKGNLLDKHTVDGLLEGTGFSKIRYYAVLPLLEAPQMIFSEDYVPKEEMGTRYFPFYHYPDTAFLEEEHLYDVIIENGLFHKLADSYLIECSNSKPGTDALQVTSSVNRDREDYFYTVIHADKTVEKIPAFKEGESRLKAIDDNTRRLKSRGLRMVDGRYEHGRYIMPYIDSETAVSYFRRLLKEDIDGSFREFDRYIETIKMSSDYCKAETLSEEEKGLSSGVFMEEGYFDLVPINCFVDHGDFVFFDQEFCVKRCPFNLLIWRAIDMIYLGREDLEYIYPRWKMWERYGIGQEIDKLRRYSEIFLEDLRNEKALYYYNLNYGSNWKMVARNRERMNISAVDDERVFLDILAGTDTKKVVLYGAGRYAKYFIDEYGNRCHIEFIIDSDPQKQGREVAGIPVLSLEEYLKRDIWQYKVIICLKNEAVYMPVLISLQNAGIRDISIYRNERFMKMQDILRRNSPNPQHSASVGNSAMIKDSSQAGSEEKAAADYHCHIGYCAGAFDMFHIGHLNLLRRAKERCDYLIVGVMSDERMYNLKNKYPVIPCNERMQVVEGCRYVDQVEELPADRAGIMDAWNMFHFDCMFSGDDHADNPGWLAERERLREHGSDIVFVSYTKEQSSSSIREQMRAADIPQG